MSPPLLALAPAGLAFLAAVLLAALPGRTAAAVRIVAASATLVLAVLSGAQSGDPIARVFAPVLASAFLAIALAAATEPPPVAGGGARGRFGRAAAAAIAGAVLLVPPLPDLALSIAALALASLVAAAAGATAQGGEAARDALARLHLAVTASLAAELGLLLATVGPTGRAPGRLLALLGVATLGPASPFALAAVRPAARLAPSLAAAVLLLPALAGAAVLLRVLAMLDPADAPPAQAFLILAAFAGLAAAALRLPRARGSAERAAASVPALLAPASFGFGLGTDAGLQAGLASLLLGALAAFAALQSRNAAGWGLAATRLAVASLPPFGTFAAALLLANAAVPTSPAASFVFLLLLGAFALAATRLAPEPAPAAVGRFGPALLASALSLLVLGGWAMPRPVSDALVAIAERVGHGGA